MNINLDQKGLSLAQRLKYMQRDLKLTDMIPVYCNKKEFVYCALIPSIQVEEALSKSSWDLMLCEHEGNNGIKPLVINREFNESQTNYGKRTRYIEISEEFRLFHNLYHDRKKEEYIKIDDEGNEHIVAAVKPDCIQIRLKEIRQFLAIKEMYLSIQFSFEGDPAYSPEELELSEDERGDEGETKPIRKSTSDGDICWWHWRPRVNPNIRMLDGKRLIKPLPKSKSDFWEFVEERKYVEFIIDVDENGEEITHTSNAPHSMDPVHFRKQVLDKYYDKPSIYLVGETGVDCPWWKMLIDNNHDDKVIVWLRELCFLPYKEQLHWRSHNIPPEGELSETYFKRYLEGSFTVIPDRPEHLFKYRYAHLQKKSEKHLSWQLLCPLEPRDEHHLKGLRVPSTDEQRDFDALVLSLTKILIDSLNQKELKKLISLKQEENLSPDQQENLKGSIGCLEIALSCCGIEDAAHHIAFLRKLQGLRSTGSAHRKGRNYQKIAKDFGLESQSLRAVFAGILSKALDVLDYFIFLIRTRQINREVIKRNEREKGYAILSQMIGIADFDPTDGSVNHDEVIYELDSKP